MRFKPIVSCVLAVVVIALAACDQMGDDEYKLLKCELWFANGKDPFDTPSYELIGEKLPWQLQRQLGFGRGYKRGCSTAPDQHPIYIKVDKLCTEQLGLAD